MAFEALIWPAPAPVAMPTLRPVVNVPDVPLSVELNVPVVPLMPADALTCPVVAPVALPTLMPPLNAASFALTSPDALIAPTAAPVALPTLRPPATVADPLVYSVPAAAAVAS